ncbi:hypothetical protein LTR36_000606 [Oleoguttula mirabilis]|uniref:Uncharacterized protein n=1 Tax=Oleoguttula mirabilis TaxID=1507867 RepID=A0AAV9JPX9_9PEZI|nr:hypothetical protein LTR36_000606 [Oleoguttula mirabilis]
MDSHDSLAELMPLPYMSEPATPQPQHATIPEGAAAAISRAQSDRIINATTNMTPPPSTQVPSSNRAKTRTPTPTVSHISTPPPTVDTHNQSQIARAFAGTMSVDDIARASAEELRRNVMELQAALHEAKMSAAHHKLQYNMLSQESAAAIERMAVEARMVQYENDVIHNAEQTKAAATPVQAPPMQEGMIPVQKDLYQRMCREIQRLTDANLHLDREQSQQERLITRQEGEIASLGDKVTLMRERIVENREHSNKARSRGSAFPPLDSTPRSVYSTPNRGHGQDQTQTQPFAALLQASEMARREGSRKKGHSRNTHSMSSLPATPARTLKLPPLYQTPAGRQAPLKIPSTAPMPRTSAMRTPGDIYTQPSLPVPIPRGPPSEGTVSASDRGEDNDNDHDNDNDSEAETDILDETDEVTESHASRAASQMLRSSQDQEAKRNSFKGNGMLSGSASQADGMKQTTLFGAVRKGNVGRGGDGDEPPAKRARVAAPQAVGLGIAGVRD